MPTDLINLFPNIKRVVIKIVLPAIFILLGKLHFAQSNDSYNISKYSTWTDSSLVGIPGMDYQKFSSIWGYYDSITQKEYAILGGINGTYFIDVTDPANPVLRDYVLGRRGNCVWREYKNYGKYLYMISDDSAPNSFQIADMSYLPDSVHVVYDSDQLFVRAHTVYVDGDKLYCGDVKLLSNTKYSMAVYSLSNNPELPQLIATLNTDYPSIDHAHDMLVRNDTIYASCGYQGFYVFRLKPDNHFEMLGSLTSYPDQGYNHSSTITENGKRMIFTDEVPNGMAVKVINTSDLSDIQVTSTFRSHPGATPHNPHILGYKVVLSYYHDGVWIYDVSNETNPEAVGFYDTFPENGNSFPGSYEGCWGVYPYLPSGILLASDMQNGLFVLNADSAYVKDVGINNTSNNESSFSASPNPFTDFISLTFKQPVKEDILIRISDFNGKIIYKQSVNLQGKSDYKINFDRELNSGLYFVNIIGNNFSSAQKLIKR